MTYTELKKKHQEAFSAHQVIWAFSKKQMTEGLAKIGLSTDAEDLKKVCSIGHGGYMLKTDVPKLHQTLEDSAKELDAAFNDPKFLQDALQYELGNHEFCITGDLTDTLAALGLDADDPRLPAVQQTAIDNYGASVCYG